MICPCIPNPHCLGRPSSPPLTPATPPCSSPAPRCPLIWSDTTTYPRQRPSQRRLSYPRVPAVCNPLSLCSYGSVTIEQSHMGAPLLPNPQWSNGNSQHAHGVVLSWNQRGGDKVPTLRWIETLVRRNHCANVPDVSQNFNDFHFSKNTNPH